MSKSTNRLLLLILLLAVLALAFSLQPSAFAAVGGGRGGVVIPSGGGGSPGTFDFLALSNTAGLLNLRTNSGNALTNLNPDASALWPFGNLTNLAVYQGAGYGFPLYGPGGTPTYHNGFGGFIGTFTGDGSGLTNIPTSILNNVTFNGKVTLNSNVYVMNLFWFTNAQSTLTINAGKALEALSTNNNLAFTGYSNIDGTNGNTFTRIYTNTAGSAAVKSITFPVGTLMHSAPYTNVVYLTNQGVFSGVIYPGFGTNATWTGF